MHRFQGSNYCEVGRISLGAVCQQEKFFCLTAQVSWNLLWVTITPLGILIKFFHHRSPMGIGHIDRTMLKHCLKLYSFVLLFFSEVYSTCFRKVIFHYSKVAWLVLLNPNMIKFIYFSFDLGWFSDRLGLYFKDDFRRQFCFQNEIDVWLRSGLGFRTYPRTHEQGRSWGIKYS